MKHVRLLLSLTRVEGIYNSNLYVTIVDLTRRRETWSHWIANRDGQSIDGVLNVCVRTLRREVKND